MLMLLTKSGLIHIKLEKLQWLPHMAARSTSVSSCRAEREREKRTYKDTEGETDMYMVTHKPDARLAEKED